MSIKVHQSSAEANQHDVMNDVDNSLIDKVWRDLDGQLPREQVGRVVTEVALGFQDAKVKAFLPILIHREALNQLRKWLETRLSVNGRLPKDNQRQPDNESTTHAIINS